MTAQVTVGVDGSDESLAATHWAAGEAVLREVPLRLVHVEEWPNTPEAPLPDSRQLDARAEALLENEADRVRREHPGLDVLVEGVRGREAEELTAAANEADLMVLGSRGLGGVLGSAVSTICWRHGGDGTPAWTSQPAWRWDPPRTRSRRRHGTRNSWLWDDGHAGSPA
ncbi:universal stress protein [Streptomyces sp. NPDC048511]|uniref:universal stress protein n=1 Tax=Streptomyces sp. NPDC048511 TaxID=3365562 RepID=UPI003712D9C3